MNNLYSAWLFAKEQERQATEARRAIEDDLIKYLSVAPNLDGTENFDDGEYHIKVVGRMTRKVDSDKLQEIAAEHGLMDHLPSLFRWKPEINMTAWKSAATTITAPLLGAITTTPGRPSFSITIKEQ